MIAKFSTHQFSKQGGFNFVQGTNYSQEPEKNYDVYVKTMII